jgi:branched-subunit amino acid ABC-type transport system permease component
VTLHEFWLQLLNGITLGGLLFLVSSGFTLIFGLMRIVNLAQGSLYLVGATSGSARFGRPAALCWPCGRGPQRLACSGSRWNEAC